MEILLGLWDTPKLTLTNVMATAIDFPEELGRILAATILSQEGLDLLPANKKLLSICDRLVVMRNNLFEDDVHMEFVLRTALQPIKDRYDYIIIDCAPKTDMLLINALAAANQIIIPVQAEYLAEEGIPDILETVNMVQDSFNPSLTVAGILITLWHTTFNLCKNVQKTIDELYGPKYHLFRPITYSIRVAEHPIYGESIISYDPQNPAALAYQALAEEVGKDAS